MPAATNRSQSAEKFGPFPEHLVGCLPTMWDCNGHAEMAHEIDAQHGGRESFLILISFSRTLLDLKGGSERGREGRFISQDCSNNKLAFRRDTKYIIRV